MEAVCRCGLKIAPLFRQLWPQLYFRKILPNLPRRGPTAATTLADTATVISSVRTLRMRVGGLISNNLNLVPNLAG